MIILKLTVILVLRQSIDKCNFCALFENKNEFLIEFESYLTEVEEYKYFKNKLLNNNKNICFEFDYIIG